MEALANACAAGVVAPCITLGVIAIAIMAVMITYLVCMLR